MIVVILAGLSMFALLAAWLVRVESTSLFPLGEVGHEEFWRRTMPWPLVVQEDDEIDWHAPRAGEPAVPPRTVGPVGSVAFGRSVPPTKPQRRIESR
jgi:hypothetical protein